LERTNRKYVTVSSYYESIPNADLELFDNDKPIVIDSKVLMLAVYDELEAYYVSGILNSPNVISVIDGYAISTNRGTDVLKYLAIPQYSSKNKLHTDIARISKDIHLEMKKQSRNHTLIKKYENELNDIVHTLFTTDWEESE